MKQFNTRAKNENVQAAIVILAVFLVIGLLTLYSMSIN